MQSPLFAYNEELWRSGGGQTHMKTFSRANAQTWLQSISRTVNGVHREINQTYRTNEKKILYSGHIHITITTSWRRQSDEDYGGEANCCHRLAKTWWCDLLCCQSLHVAMDNVWWEVPLDSDMCGHFDEVDSLPWPWSPLCKVSVHLMSCKYLYHHQSLPPLRGYCFASHRR